MRVRARVKCARHWYTWSKHFSSAKKSVWVCRARCGKNPSKTLHREQTTATTQHQAFCLNEGIVRPLVILAAWSDLKRVARMDQRSLHIKIRHPLCNFKADRDLDRLWSCERVAELFYMKQARSILATFFRSDEAAKKTSGCTILMGPPTCDFLGSLVVVFFYFIRCITAVVDVMNIIDVASLSSCRLRVQRL